MQRNEIVWICKLTVSQMLAEADRTFPNETGGVLIGYWVKQYEEAVITHATGPGPHAVHRSNSFVPDSEYQEMEIKKHYHTSERLHIYLGDWHTHPRERAYLSSTDRRTLRKIATHSEARARVPLMAVLGEDPEWILKVWRYIPPRFGRFHLTIKTVSLQLKVY